MNTKELIKLYRDSGRIAFLYPRLKQISIGGGQREPIKEAVKKMKECLIKEGILK